MTTLGKSITGGVLILILIASGYYFTRPEKDTTSSDTNTKTAGGEQRLVPPTESSSTETVSKNEVGKKMAFSQFLKQGGAYTCTVNQTINNETSKGTMYIDNGKVRSEFTIAIKGQNIAMNFLVLDGYSYMWNSMTPTMGFKIKNDTEATVTATPNAPVAWNADQIGDYTCDTWTVDTSKFTVPSTVKFSTMGN
jgi:hypothetical protein